MKVFMTLVSFLYFSEQETCITNSMAYYLLALKVRTPKVDLNRFKLWYRLGGAVFEGLVFCTLSLPVVQAVAFTSSFKSQQSQAESSHESF